MVKLMSLFKSAPGVLQQQFADYWRDKFLPDFMELETSSRQLSKAVHHHVIPSAIRDAEGLPGNKWAGVGCYYFDTQTAAEALLVDPAFRTLLEAHRAVLPEATHLLVNELWMYDRDRSHLPIKMFAFFKRKAGWTRVEAQHYYRTTHAEIGETVNRNRTVRYVQNHVVAGYQNPDSAYDYDAGPEIWFKTMDIAMDLFSDREAMETLARDEERFVIRNELLSFLTDEASVFERNPVSGVLPAGKSMMTRQDELRESACRTMIALAEGRFTDADAMFHPDARWWIIGQGALSHARVRELATMTEGPLSVRRLRILGTVAEGDKVAVEAVGEMEFPDGRRYANTYHHVIEFRGDRIIGMREYFDTNYVREVFGQGVYERPA
jgi:ketosteroid isomerase-like protein